MIESASKLNVTMGVESGGGMGDASPSREISGGRSPRTEDISVFFFLKRI